MGVSASKEEDPFQQTLLEDPDLQPDSFPSSDGKIFSLPESNRVLGYEIYGNDQAPLDRSILFMHGTPGTRFFFSKTHSDYAKTHDIRVIVPERPGFGLSTPVASRSMKSTVDDIPVLLEEIGCGRVHVIGYSAGGPFALAFARYYPSLCSTVSLISSLSPNVKGVSTGMSMTSKFAYFLCKHMPWLLRKVVHLMVRDALKENFEKHRSDFIEEENEFFAKNVDVRKTFIRSTLELYSRESGPTAEGDDYVLMAKEWGFELSEIASDIKLFVYGGSLDNKCTNGMYEVLTNGLPKDNLKTFKGVGKHHLWFYELFEDQMLQDIGIL